MTAENLDAALDANIDDFLAQKMPSLDPPMANGTYLPQGSGHAGHPPDINVHVGAPSGLRMGSASAMTPTHDLSNTMESTLHLTDGSISRPAVDKDSGPLMGFRHLMKSDSDSFNKTVNR